MFNSCFRKLVWLSAYDRFWVDIYRAHVLISTTFAVFEYLDTALATENKILRFSRAVLPYKIESSNVNRALILFFCGHTSYKRVSWKKEGVATRGIRRLKRAWLMSSVMNRYVLSQISETPVVRSKQFFQNSKKNGSSWSRNQICSGYICFHIYTGNQILSKIVDNKNCGAWTENWKKFVRWINNSKFTSWW